MSGSGLPIDITSRWDSRVATAAEILGVSVDDFVADAAATRAREVIQRVLEVPSDTTLPLFVYGNLKPGELGFELVREHVADMREAWVEGALWERDGMPMLTLSGGWSVAGWLLWFDDPSMYSVVAAFEPRTHYRWSTVSSSAADPVLANTLSALRERSNDGHDLLLDAPWSTVRDPLFTHGLASIANVLRQDGMVPFEEPIHQPDEWQRFYRIQSAFMLACAILERLTLRVVPGKLEKPSQAINILGRTDDFSNAAIDVGLQNLRRKVGRADKPQDGASLNDPKQFASWVYQVRSNVAHQGKSASTEGELVRTALLDLHDVLRSYLLAKLPAIRGAWEAADPVGASVGWQVKKLSSDHAQGW